MITEKNRTAMSAESDMESLTPYEIAMSRPYQMGIRTDICVDDEGNVTMTTENFGKRAMDSWLESKSKKVVDAAGVKLYDSEGNLTLEVPNESELLTALDDQELDELGIHHPFQQFDQSESSELASEGYTLLILEDGRNYLGAEDHEIIYDEANRQVIFNEISENLITLQTIKNYTPYEDGYLLVQEIMYEYRSLPSGNVMRIETEKEYYDYRLDGELMIENQAISRMQQEKSGNSSFFSVDKFNKYDRETKYIMKVRPNPAHSWVTVFVPSLDRYVSGSIFLYDMEGKKVLSKLNVNTGEESTLYVENLPEGVYVIQSVVGSEIFSQSLLITNTQ